jgi:hypothetical protein
VKFDDNHGSATGFVSNKGSMEVRPGINYENDKRGIIAVYPVHKS